MKGIRTREQILDQAIRMASILGLEGLTIGNLARTLHMSKSGLFAHFQSKENLQKMVVEATAERWVHFVFDPALEKARGLERVQALFEGWLAWENAEFLPGGCLIMSSAFEFDDRPGEIHDQLVLYQRRLYDTFERAVRLAIDEGDLRVDLNEKTFVFAWVGLFLAYIHRSRMLEFDDAEQMLRQGFAALVERSRA